MLKILFKIPKEWGLYTPNPKTSRWLKLSAKAAGGRPAGRPPTVIFMTVGRSRSTTQKQRAKLSRPVDRPKCLANVHRLVHVGRPPSRPTLGPVDRSVDRQSLAGWVLGQKIGFKINLINPIKLLKFHKNSFIILH